jgi:hypothetical protein
MKFRINKPIYRFQSDLFLENYRQETFMETVEIMQDLEFADPKVIRQLYDYVFHSAEENREMVNEVYLEFQKGMNDPSRAVAFCEKQNFIKKNVNKQRIKQYNI